jgi:hypothetical protein
MRSKKHEQEEQLDTGTGRQRNGREPQRKPAENDGREGQ